MYGGQNVNKKQVYKNTVCHRASTLSLEPKCLDSLMYFKWQLFSMWAAGKTVVKFVDKKYI